MRLHIRDQESDFDRFGERYGAPWTPTILELDPDGVEQHRIEGFLPVDDFLAQLKLGAGHAAFKRQDWKDAERRFRAVVADHASTESAPEALYWAGVARYKGTKDGRALAETADAFAKLYSESSWAKKASVWLKS